MSAEIKKFALSMEDKRKRIVQDEPELDPLTFQELNT
jgi:hypothetical protein